MQMVRLILESLSSGYGLIAWVQNLPTYHWSGLQCTIQAKPMVSVVHLYAMKSPALSLTQATISQPASMMPVGALLLGQLQAQCQVKVSRAHVCLTISTWTRMRLKFLLELVKKLQKSKQLEWLFPFCIRDMAAFLIKELDTLWMQTPMLPW